MREALTLLLASLLILVAEPALAGVSCKVVGVSDGDTLTCLTAAKEQIKVRLAQIDAPEKAQPFGERSKQALSSLVFSEQVILEPETTDKYGRMVAKVMRDGQDVNLEMVRSGMAWVYDQYARDREYFAAHNAAKQSRAGLWSDPSPVRPSDWRRGHTGGAARAPSTVVEPQMVKPVAASSGFSCGAKRYCKEMSSCAEAQHYLNVCGLSRIDGDGDGVPCEAICR